MPNYYSEKAYDGPEAIVVAMDIGTTQSAVSFAYFSPGYKPHGNMVARWPGRDQRSTAAKTPSVLSYKDGKVKACGAEALQDFEENEKTVAVASWFKLHLHPAMTSNTSQKFEIPPLPAGVNIVGVYADMMNYLMENTRRYFEMTTTDGEEIWARVRDTIVIVLATPNGWETREQATLRKAAIRASLVTEENSNRLLQFVTESEASVHYVLAQDPSKWLKGRTIFAVMDCGGSTVDTTVYRCVSLSPLSLYETCASACVQAGGIFINREVEKMLESKLKGSSFSDPERIKSMMDSFEMDLKPKFDGVMDKYSVRFGINSDNDPSVGISKGKITLSKEELRKAFNAVIDKFVRSGLELIRSQKAEYVILVGGFAESPYLRKVLSQELERCAHRVGMITVGEYTKKAAAEGAIIGHIKQFVVARAARATFGGCVRALYDQNLHRERSPEIYPDGKRRVDGAFHKWISKGTVLHHTFAHKLSYHIAWEPPKDKLTQIPNDQRLKVVEIEVFAWERDGVPIWCKDERGEAMEGMRLICTLRANLSALAGALQLQPGENFYRVDYDVCVYFGGTQLRANLQWKENGVLREGPVAVMPYVS